MGAPNPEWSLRRKRIWYRKWVKRRFERAGIARPRVEYRYSNGGAVGAKYWTDGERHIVTLNVEGHDDVVIKKVLLHELGHAYEYLHENETRRQDWLRLCELDHWAAGPWGQRGAEHYAEHFAWGLMDRDVRLLGIGDPSVTVKRLRFRWITGKAALN